MKKPITFLTLLCSFVFCSGQKKDSALIKIIGSGTEIYPNYLTDLKIESGNYVMYATVAPRQDTISVILLCIDTSDKKDCGFEFIKVASGGILEFINQDTCITYKDYSTQWQFGYEVKQDLDELDKKYGLDWYKHYWEDAIYLDKDKKPLPKSIVVFMTKEIPK